MKEFEGLVQDLSSDISAPKYVNVLTSKPKTIKHETDWRQKTLEDCFNAILNEQFSMMMMVIKRGMKNKKSSSALQNLLQYLIK